MPAIKQALSNTRGSSSRFYWYCQLGGWLGFGLFLLFANLFYNSRARFWPVVILELARVILGLAGTHVLHLAVRKWHWLEMPGGKLVARLVGAVLLIAAILEAIETLTGRFQPQVDGMSSQFDLRRVTAAWVGWIVIVTGWTTLYLVIHEFRGRRARELHALRLEMMVQEAQLRGLRAQLNPHFLFNCLNDLREVIAEDSERAQTMVTQLSELLRYALDSNQHELVPLSNELQAVEDYLSLEKIRFEERLHVLWFVDPEALNIPIPPMLLQTLVENALKHGIARQMEGGEVSISAQLRDGELQLEVTNSGEIMFERSPAAGVGLKNAQERLSLLYGERASLSVQSHPDDRVRALVKLPLARVEVPA